MSKQKREPEPPRRRPLRTWAAAAAFVLLAGAAARSRFVYVVSLRNGEPLFTRYPLLEERWDHPRLQLLRRREKLDEVVAPGATQFDKIVLLRHWARSQWKTTVTPFYYPPWDAVEILDLARQRRNYGFCSQYAVVFLQACLSMGLHARYVDLGHFITEVWSDEWDRWVIMDPTNDLHYEKDGEPMRGRRLAEAALAGKPDGIFKVGSDGTRTHATLDDIKMFANFSVVLRNDQLSQPELVEDNGKMRRLTREADYRRYPRVGKDRIGYADDFVVWRPGTAPKSGTSNRRFTDDPQDLRMVLNQTLMFVAARDPRRAVAKVKLFPENAPEFETFLGRWEGAAPVDVGREVVLELKPGLNRFYARVKTKAGWVGPEASVTILYKPAWPAFKSAAS